MQLTIFGSGYVGLVTGQDGSYLAELLIEYVY